MAGEVLTIDSEMYEYLMDKGPMTSFGCSVERQDIEYIRSLRVLGFRRGFTACLDKCGCFCINKSLLDEGRSATQLLTAPCLAKMKDSGSGTSFVLEWKATGENIYAMCLPTALKIPTNDPDKDPKWLTEKDLKPVRINLIESVEPVRNTDGFQFAKTLTTWLGQHASHFKKLKLTTLPKCTQWCSYEQFRANFEVVRSVMLADAEAEMEKAVGLQSAPDNEAVKKLYEDKVSKFKPLWEAVVNRLETHVNQIGVPLSQRMIELDIDPEASSFTEAAEEWKKALTQALGAGANQEISNEFLELLQRKDYIFTKLKSGEFEPIYGAFSPLWAPPDDGADGRSFGDSDSPICVENATATPGVNTASAKRLFDDKASADRTAKRNRQPTNRLAVGGDSISKKKSPKKTPPKKGNKKKSPSKNRKSNRPKNYNCTGLYSKDPAKVALAKAALQRGGPKQTKPVDLESPIHSFNLSSISTGTIDFSP